MRSKIKCTCHGKMQSAKNVVKVVFCMDALPALVEPNANEKDEPKASKASVSAKEIERRIEHARDAALQEVGMRWA